MPTYYVHLAQLHEAADLAKAGMDHYGMAVFGVMVFLIIAAVLVGIHVKIIKPALQDAALRKEAEIKAMVAVAEARTKEAESMRRMVESVEQVTSNLTVTTETLKAKAIHVENSLVAMEHTSENLVKATKNVVGENQQKGRKRRRA